MESEVKPRTRKTPDQVLMQPYASALDLSIVLKIGYSAAKGIWKLMSKEDDKDLGIYRTQPKKIRLRPALKRLGISYKDLCELYGVQEATKKSASL